MNRRSFIARTIAAASALMAGKSVAEAADKPLQYVGTIGMPDDKRIYDIFAWYDGQTWRAECGPAWESATNRGEQAKIQRNGDIWLAAWKRD